jgi:cobalt-zinc-cadmium resistance protein CzcA
MILFALYGNFKFPVTIALGVVLTEPVGALIALKLTRTPFSVSSTLGLLALMGVSVETAVILVSISISCVLRRRTSGRQPARRLC